MLINIGSDQWPDLDPQQYIFIDIWYSAVLFQSGQGHIWYCAFYFRVDKDKGYIDLSKRRVSKEDIERCTEKYSKVNDKAFFYSVGFLLALFKNFNAGQVVL